MYTLYWNTSQGKFYNVNSYSFELKMTLNDEDRTDINEVYCMPENLFKVAARVAIKQWDNFIT